MFLVLCPFHHAIPIKERLVFSVNFVLQTRLLLWNLLISHQTFQLYNVTMMLIATKTGFIPRPSTHLKGTGLVPRPPCLQPGKVRAWCLNFSCHRLRHCRIGYHKPLYTYRAAISLSICCLSRYLGRALSHQPTADSSEPAAFRFKPSGMLAYVGGYKALHDTPLGKGEGLE